MFMAKFTFLIALWPSVFNLGCVESGDVPSRDEFCQYLCHPLPPPPPPALSGYPSYGAPPPPPLSGYPSFGAPPPPPPLSGYPSHREPPPPPLSGYPSYGAPPPAVAQSNCPPTPIVQCCHFPPRPPYGYMPNDNYSASSLPLSFFSVMILLFSFVVLYQV